MIEVIEDYLKTEKGLTDNYIKDTLAKLASNEKESVDVSTKEV